MEKATSEQEFAGGGFDKHQVETPVAALNRTKHHWSNISTLKWAAGLYAVAFIAGFAWLGSEIRETRDSLSTRIDGLEVRIDGLETRMDDLAIAVARVEARVDSLETRIDDLAIGMTRVEASIEALSERQARIETLLDKRLPSQL